MSRVQRSRVRGSGLALVASALLLTGCVLPDRIAQQQKEVADIRQQLIALRKDQAGVRDSLAAIEAKVEAGGEVKRTEFADLNAELVQLRGEVSAIGERSMEMQRRMDRLSEEAARRTTSRPPAETPALASPGTKSGPVPGASAATAAGAVPSPEALYNQAYADFSKGNYALAVSGFEEYSTSFPSSGLADNAVYWIGECHFAQGRFDLAVDAFDRLLEKYVDSERAAAANLKKGLAYLEENDVKLAILQLRYVTTTYPSSDEAKVAREKLQSLGAGP